MFSQDLKSDVAMHQEAPPTIQEPQDLSLPSHKTTPPPPSPSSILSTVSIPNTFTQRKRRILSALAVPDEDYTDLSPKGTVDAGIRELIDEINGLDGFVTTSSCAGRVSVFLEGRRVREGGGDVGSGGVPGRDGGGELPGHYVADLAEGEAMEDGEGEEELDEVVDGSGRRRRVLLGGGGGGGGGERETVAGFGGKGGGGRWLFVSHDPVESNGKLDSEPNIVAALLGMEEPIFSGVEGSSAEEMTGQGSRLIHFKFEPMVGFFLLFYSPVFFLCSPNRPTDIMRC